VSVRTTIYNHEKDGCRIQVFENGEGEYFLKVETSNALIVVLFPDDLLRKLRGESMDGCAEG
jgi:hypothetical protein